MLFTLRLHQLGPLLVLLFLLVGCGASAAPPAPDAAPPSDPSAVARQVIEGLAEQDAATLTQLVDAEMPQREAQLGGTLQQWRDRGADPGYYFYPALGAYRGADLAPPEPHGQTTIIHAVVHHAHGDAQMTLSLIQRPQGWRVIAWSSRVVSHPTPTPGR